MAELTRWKIRINNAGAIFTYHGNIISEDSSFIFLNDDKEGPIKLNKSIIISMQEVGGKNGTN